MMQETSSYTHEDELYGTTKAGRRGFFVVLAAERAFGDEFDASLGWHWNVLTHCKVEWRSCSVHE
jgi:hypothetical protein